MEKYNILSRKTENTLTIIRDIKTQIRCGTNEAMLILNNIEKSIETGDTYFTNIIDIDWVLHSHFNVLEHVNEDEYSYKPDQHTDLEIEQAKAWYDNLNSIEKKYITILYSPAMA
jgi:TPP-dependent 2-oxoacid decarboxylase